MNYERQLSIYRSAIREQLQACQDLDLLDLVFKLLADANNDHGCEIVQLFPVKEVNAA